MTIQEAVLTYLLAEPTVADLVGDRIYTNHLPDPPVFPAVSVRLVSVERGRNLDGPNGVVRARVQVESWSDSFRTSLEIAEAVRLAVQGYVGPMGAVAVRHTTLEDDVDTPEPPDDGTSGWVYAKALVFSLLYHEPIPSH